LAAVATNVMEARPITEALVGGEGLFGIIVKGRHHGAFEYQTYSNNRVRMVAGICPRRIGDEVEARLPTPYTFDWSCLQQLSYDFDPLIPLIFPHVLGARDMELYRADLSDILNRICSSVLWIATWHME
jgi:hypothetical protein